MESALFMMVIASSIVASQENCQTFWPGIFLTNDYLVGTRLSMQYLESFLALGTTFGFDV